MNKALVILGSVAFSTMGFKIKETTELPPELIETIITTIVAILSYIFGKKKANINNKNKFQQ